MSAKDIRVEPISGKAAAAIVRRFHYSGKATKAEVGYKGSKRYLRAMVVTASSTTGALSGASIVKGYPRIAPAT